MAGRWSRRVRINVRFARRGRARARARPARDPRPAAPVQRASWSAAAATRCSCCRGSSRSRRPAAAAPARARAAARGSDPGVMGRRLDASPAELEIDGLRPYREGAPASRIHWPTVARTRRDARAPAGGRARLRAAGRARPVRRRRARRRSTRRCAPPPRCACTWPRAAAARSCSPATGARSRSGTTWPRGRPCTSGSRWSRRARAPPASTLGPRGGAVIWVTGAGLHSAPRALERLPAGARIVVSPAALPGSAPRSVSRGAPAAWSSERAGGSRRRERRAAAAAPPRASGAPPRRRGRGAERAARWTPWLRLAAFAGARRVRRRPLGALVDAPPAGRTCSWSSSRPPRRRCARARRAGRPRLAPGRCSPRAAVALAG